jgi:glycerophosphoryl diester phosphodiesterase
MLKQTKTQPKKLKKSNFWTGAKFPLAVAHRGGDAAGFAKRNTMAAFRSADELGYKYIETDVVSSKDAQVIIAHGAKTRLGAHFRGTFTFNKLQGLNYEQIQSGLRVDGEPIPLLIDVIKALPDTNFFIDVKSDAVVEPLAKLLEDNNLLDRVFIVSFKYRRLMQIQSLLNNRVELGLLIGRHLNLVHKLYRVRAGRLNHLEAISINHWFASRSRVSIIHKQGLKAIVWTLNSHKNIHRALDNKADVLMSDHIVLLKQLLQNNTKP